jgi:hypothetical protein
MSSSSKHAKLLAELAGARAALGRLAREIVAFQERVHILEAGPG